MFIDGSRFLQVGEVFNNSASAQLDVFIFSLGMAEAGVATWGTYTGGGTASDFLSDPRWFQTITWSGLSIAPGASFSFGSLDIDLITTPSPLGLDEWTIDGSGGSLRNAFVRAGFSDGSWLEAELNETGWLVDQELVLGGTDVVPEPATLILLGTGLLGLAGAAPWRRVWTSERAGVGREAIPRPCSSSSRGARARRVDAGGGAVTSAAGLLPGSPTARSARR